MGILGPTIELISTGINNEYLRRFPCWPSSGTQEDYLDILINGDFYTNSLKYYWICRGTILVKDTRYDPPKNGYPYKAEFSGKPEFQLAYFDLDKINQCNEMAKKFMPQLKRKIDELENKLIEQRIQNLLINIDMIDI